MRIKAAAVQMEALFGDIAHNLARLESLLREVGDADLIVAPELVTTGYDLERLENTAHELAEPADGITVKTVERLAHDLDATLVVGFLEGGDHDAVYDSVVIASPDNTTTYRKTHLYPPELRVFAAGEELATRELSNGVSLGAMICFEHAFPEVATTLAVDGADVLVIPSAVPRGYEHLLTLRTRARAQDNQVFVVASNLTGGDFVGGSLIVDPKGEVLASIDHGEGAITAMLDLDMIEEERSKEPALRLRRPELYR